MCSPRPHEKVSLHSHTLISSRGSGEGAAHQSCTANPVLHFADSVHGVTLATNAESTYFILI